MEDRQKIINELLLKGATGGSNIDYSKPYAIVYQNDGWFSIIIWENGSSCAIAVDTRKEVDDTLAKRGITNNVEWHL